MFSESLVGTVFFRTVFRTGPSRDISSSCYPFVLWIDRDLLFHTFVTKIVGMLLVSKSCFNFGCLLKIVF